jgi:predicted nucleic acid-binding protein
LILLDASGLLAAYDDTELEHEAALRALRASNPPRIVSPFVLAEVDYLVGRNVGRHAQGRVLSEVAGGAYRLPRFGAQEVGRAREVIERYSDLAVGLADASIVVLAHRFDVHDVLTLDERHFRVLQGPRGPFRLLPADA